MAADNHTTIVGNLVEDPEVRFSNGIAVTNLRVAVTQRVQQDGQDGHGLDRDQGATSGQQKVGLPPVQPGRQDRQPVRGESHRKDPD